MRLLIAAVVLLGLMNGKVDAQESKTENYIEKQHRLLDMAEQRYALEQRKEELRKKGIIPPKQEGYFLYQGKKFKSFADFKESPEYSDYLLECAKRRAEYQAEEAAKERRYQESVDFLRMWRKMSPMAQESYGRMSQFEKDRALREFKNPDLRWERYKEEDAVKFYRSYPWLIHKAGQNGYPEASDQVKQIFKDDLERKLHEARPDLYPIKPEPPSPQ